MADCAHGRSLAGDCAECDADYPDELDDEYEGWLCVCGMFTDNCHCPSCFREAPWASAQVEAKS